MARYAIIENNTVVNVVEAEDAIARKNGWVLTDLAGPGWSHDNGVFTAPIPNVASEPPAPTKEQLMAELAALTAKIQALE